MKFVKICIGRGRNKFENLCPIPLKKDSIKYVQTRIKLRRWRSQVERSPRMRKIGCSNPDRDRNTSLKQIVTAPLLNALQKGVGVTGPLR